MTRIGFKCGRFRRDDTSRLTMEINRPLEVWDVQRDVRLNHGPAMISALTEFDIKVFE